MKRINKQSVLRVITLAALCVGGALSLAAAGGAARTVEIIADKDNTFKLAGGEKGTLTLKAGEVINFKINSLFGGEKARDGAVHSFVVRSLRDKGWSVRLKEGVQEFTLTAPSAGKYLIECTVECGKGHDSMSMPMVVVK
jgi:heme/copper-type cytochrome/quinol oxidase subunit 2